MPNSITELYGFEMLKQSLFLYYSRFLFLWVDLAVMKNFIPALHAKITNAPSMGLHMEPQNVLMINYIFTLYLM